jgi:hypothetical protein
MLGESVEEVAFPDLTMLDYRVAAVVAAGHEVSQQHSREFLNF